MHGLALLILTPAGRHSSPCSVGSRTSAVLDVEYNLQKFVFHWSGPELLSIGDQSVFLAIHRLAAQPGRAEQVGPNHDNPLFVTIRLMLDMSYEAESFGCLVQRIADRNCDNNGYCWNRTSTKTN